MRFCASSEPSCAPSTARRMCSFGQEASACIRPDAYSAASLSCSPGKLRLAQSYPSIPENVFDFDMLLLHRLDEVPGIEERQAVVLPFHFGGKRTSHQVVRKFQSGGGVLA